jgi:hypothetical protein
MTVPRALLPVIAVVAIIAGVLIGTRVWALLGGG